MAPRTLRIACPQKREGRREKGEERREKPPPLPPPVRGGGAPPDPRKRGAMSSTGKWQKGAKNISAEVPTVAVQLSPADIKIWMTAQEDAAADMNGPNAVLLAALEPVGRSADGGLLLRAHLGRVSSGFVGRWRGRCSTLATITRRTSR